MINSHQFKEAAKKFRAGRISLSEFTDLLYDNKPLRPTHQSAPAPKTKSTEPADASLLEGLVRRLRHREADTHKGDFGRVLAIGGSEGMAGAISLTGMAALRCGSGLVKVAVPETVQPLVAAINPCLMTIGCAAASDSFHAACQKSLSYHSQWADVIAIGPGMGRGEAQQWIVKHLYADIAQPMVVDADGLNALADCSDIDLAQHAGQRILTPHPGEFCRLIDQQITRRTELENRAIQLADHSQAVVVLKGNRTFVTDGQQTYRNASGNPGMATAGAGDVLTGTIASLLGQGFSTFEASVLGVFLHGVAGDEAAKASGEASLIATDIVEHLSTAIRSS